MTFLPVFKGYTIDTRLKQLRYVHDDGAIDFIEFDSEEGDAIICEYIRSLDPESDAFRNIADAVC